MSVTELPSDAIATTIPLVEEPSPNRLMAVDLPVRQVTVRLGLKVPDKPPEPTVRLSDFLSLAELAPAPAVVDYHSRIDAWGMMLNDKIGCCAIASPGHQIMTWTYYDGVAMIRPSDAEILAAYSAVSGYDPRTGRNDNGCYLEDVLKYWTTRGIGGQKIFGFAGVKPTDATTTKMAIHHFGGLYLGLNMPSGWQRQTGPGGIWTANAGQAGTWGGHAVPVVGYDSQYLTVITWGQKQRMTWDAYRQYCFQAFATISTNWLNADWTPPTGVKAKELVDALRRWGGSADDVPDVNPPSPPTPTPPNGRKVTVVSAELAGLTVEFVAPPKVPFEKAARDAFDENADLLRRLAQH